MSDLAALVGFLLVMVCLLCVSGLAYLVRQHPTLTQPLTVALTGVGVFVAVASAAMALNPR
ncbi:hypothetical protein [Streptomyces sp. NPDC001675]